MNNTIAIKHKESISKYIETNRTKIDEALISLRLMKQIDSFIEYKNINQKQLAIDLDISPAFISQLMSGVKKINTSFINRFEKTYNVKFKFIIQENEAEYIFIESILSSNEISFHFKKNNFSSIENIQNSSFSFNSNDNVIEIQHK